MLVHAYEVVAQPDRVVPQGFTLFYLREKVVETRRFCREEYAEVDGR